MQLLAPDVTLSRLQPFGLMLETDETERDIDFLTPCVLQDLLAAEPYVVLRGFTPLDIPQFRSYCGNLGGEPSAARELVVHDRPSDYRFSHGRIPLHCTEIVGGRAARYAAVQCFGAQERGTGGQTLLSDTTRALKHASPAQRDRWARTTIRYEVSERPGARVEERLDLVETHPGTGEQVLRYAEPFRRNDWLGAVTVAVEHLSDDATLELVAELDDALYADEVCVAHSWERYDIMFTDERRLLRGRCSVRGGGVPTIHLQEILIFDD